MQQQQQQQQHHHGYARQFLPQVPLNPLAHPELSSSDVGSSTKTSLPPPPPAAFPMTTAGPPTQKVCNF
jgi:hypothetical protein